MGSTIDDDDSLAPGFLVASPKLEGSPFERAVIVMVHHDAQGAMGFIINKPVEIDFGSLLESADEPIDGTIADRSFQQTVLFGGPVRVEQLWVLFHDQGAGAHEPGIEQPVDELDQIAQIAFHRDWVVASAGSVIERFATGERTEPYHPVIGYAGWGPGQLESEIEEGSWLAVDFEETLLSDTPPGECWEAALEVVGLDPASFVMMGDGGMA